MKTYIVRIDTTIINPDNYLLSDGVEYVECADGYHDSLFSNK